MPVKKMYKNTALERYGNKLYGSFIRKPAALKLSARSHVDYWWHPDDCPAEQGIPQVSNFRDTLFFCINSPVTVNTALITNGKENHMQLSEKELSSINDLLSEEELLTKKFKMLAEQTTDTELKDKFTNISERHQQHFNSLYKLLG